MKETRKAPVRLDHDPAIVAVPKRGATLYERGVVKARLGDSRGGEADIAAARAIDAHAGGDMTAVGITP